MHMQGASIITRLLERQGIRTVAGIPGGCNLPLYDALRESSIRHVLARHEQGAGFIAQGMARATGRAAVCLATSGPGATNLLTAVADARLDSVPLVAITGQVPVGMIGTDAFQEIDTYGLTLPITKHNFLVRDARDLLAVLPEAFTIAESGRPGPVVVDVPKDVQLQWVDFDAWPEPGGRTPPPPPDLSMVRAMADRIARAERPVLYIGGGIIAAGASDALRVFARRNGIPVATTLNGLGAFPADDPLFLGMLGMHGARHTNMVLEEADLLIALGVRFDDRAIGRAEAFCPGAAVVHVDIDPAEISKIRPADLALEADVQLFLDAVLPMVPVNARPGWNARVAALRAAAPFRWPANGDPLHPLTLLREMGRRLPTDTVVTTDVGQHQMWVAQAYPFARPRTLLTSGGLGTMGFGLPAAIGAALARPGMPVVCVSGDGSLLMNVQELATLGELGLPVKILLMNNRHLGLVRQQQEMFYGERYIASRFEQGPDFAGIARAFGVEGVDLAFENDPEAALWEALERPGPCLIDLPVRHEENVLPMVPPGGANRDMIGHETAEETEGALSHA
jgi:acetolactate synthase I/II/III large subunit